MGENSTLELLDNAFAVVLVAFIVYDGFAVVALVVSVVYALFPVPF